MSTDHQTEPQKQIVVYHGIRYSINEREQTAAAILLENKIDKIFIPRSVNYELKEYYVTCISKGAFDNSHIISVKFAKDSKLQIIEEDAFSKTLIKKIKIPSEVKIIGKGAFFRCEELQRITFSEDSQLQTIEDYAFKNTSIKSIAIPSKVTDLKDNWSVEMKYLQKIIVSQSNPRYSSVGDVMIIGKSLIESNKYDLLVSCLCNVKYVTIPDSVKRIENYAFSDTSIEAITIPSGIEVFGKCAFQYCFFLTKIEFEKNSKLQIIEKDAFQSSKIKSITIPSEVRKIGKRAFFCCGLLTKIEFEKNSKLQEIEESAFCGSSIESIEIPSGVIDIKENAFLDLEKLKKISFDPSNPRYYGHDEKMIIGKSKIESDDYDCLLFCIQSVKNVIIPDSIKQIGPYSFCRSLIESITIPSEVTVIEKKAFYDCKNLQQIEFAKNSKLQIIEKGVFNGTSIKSIIIPPEVKKIGKKAFYDCKKLQQIEFSKDSKLQTIGEDAFKETLIESIKIPSGVTDLNEDCFFGASKLKNVSIDSSNPRYCLYDEKMVIGKSSIESNDYDCLVFCPRNIKNVTIPKFIKQICSNAFYKSSIERITIPSEVTIIGKYAFSNCRQLRQIEFEKNSKLQILDEMSFVEASIDSIIIPSNVRKIGKNAFLFCDNLKTIEFEKDSKLQVIEEGAFYKTIIEDIEIPSEVTDIAEYPFNECYHLNIIEINENSKLRTINEKFYEYSNLLMIPVKLRYLFISEKKVPRELACVYAALILYDDNIEINADKIKSILNAASVNVESHWIDLFVEYYKNLGISELIKRANLGNVLISTLKDEYDTDTSSEESDTNNEEEEEVEVDLSSDLFG